MCHTTKKKQDKEQATLCKESTMTRLSLVYLLLFALHAHAWMQRKMLSSFWAGRYTAPKPEARTGQPDRPTPLIMTTVDVEGVDVLASKPVWPGRERRQIPLGNQKKATVLSRKVQITSDWTITVWEWEKPSAVVETYWAVEEQGLALTPSLSESQKTPLLDPFGLVCWPGSVVAAQEMKEYRDLFAGRRVLILGAGVGVEAQAAAMMGAKHVIATDIHPTTLKLCKYGAEQAGLSSVISTKKLDLSSVEPLPTCDIIVVADVLYNERLALLVIKRILESQRQNNPAPPVLVTDSQRFVQDFDETLSRELKKIGEPSVQWASRWLPTFTGSGVVVDADQTYDVKARVLWVNKNQ